MDKAFLQKKRQKNCFGAGSIKLERQLDMKIESIDSPAFRPYGKVVGGYDFKEFLEILRQTPVPEGAVVYVPSDSELEGLPVAKELADRFYGGMPIQVGYCNGHNATLNCLEYHRDSEVDVFATDAVLLVAMEQEIERGTLHTDCVKVFCVPAGTAVELYATTLHYAPCSSAPDTGFQVSIVLPKGTNAEAPAIERRTIEDAMLWARNKWLLSHMDAPEAREGAYVGLVGENLRLF